MKLTPIFKYFFIGLGILTFFVSIHEIGHLIDNKLYGSRNDFYSFCGLGWKPEGNEVAIGWVQYYSSMIDIRTNTELFPNLLSILCLACIYARYKYEKNKKFK